MDVYRIDLEDYTHRHIKRMEIQGEVRSNMLEDEIAGCVVSSWGSGPMDLYMVNWKTGKTAIIKTGIQVSDVASVLLTTYKLV